MSHLHMPKHHDSCDAVIIGGGHNGLVCACYLAARGWKVRVLERRAILGGAAVTEEFHPGFRNSTASYTVSLLHPTVIRDLHLDTHGLKILERPIANFLPLEDGRYLKIGGGLAATQSEVAKFSEKDAARRAAAARTDREDATKRRGDRICRSQRLVVSPGLRPSLAKIGPSRQAESARTVRKKRRRIAR